MCVCVHMVRVKKYVIPTSDLEFFNFQFRTVVEDRSQDPGSGIGDCGVTVDQ